MPRAPGHCEGEAEPGNGSAEQPPQERGVFPGQPWGAEGISLAGRGREEEVPLVGILWMEESTGEVECRGLRCKEDEWLHTFTVVC